MTNSATLVERLETPDAAWANITGSDNLDAYVWWLKKQMREAAARITELEAERIDAAQ